jgi:hypothetical protein
MNKRNIVVGAVCLALVGFIVYKANQVGPAFPDPVTTVEIGPIGEPPPVLEEDIIVVTEPIVVIGKVDKAPFRSGTKLCNWYEDAGMRAVADADGWAESTCSVNTCFLLVHEAGIPAPWVMSAWLSEARNEGHDPRKENIELSVFTFEDGKETDHIIYFPSHDVFESY